MNTGKQISSMIILLLVLLVGVGLYTIYDPFRAEAEAERTREEMATRAAHVFARNCRSCHGNNGEGRVGPALNPEIRANNPGLTHFADPTKLKENQQLVKNTLECGRIGTLMPPWSQAQGGSLNDEQIRQLTLLITNPPKDAWKHLEEITAEEEALIPNPPVTEITAGASPTGSTSPVCGQRAPAQEEVTGPVEVKTDWVQDATDNKFSVRAMGIPAGREATVVFNNKGQAIHNWHVLQVKDARGQDVATKLLPGGQSETLRFTITTAGSYQFLCDVHPVDMKGTLRVENQ